MKKDLVFLDVDSCNRLTLTLEQVKAVPKEEEWLFDPANKEIVNYLKECLQQEVIIDFSSLKKKLKKKK
jgi:hypothetical protein